MFESMNIIEKTKVQSHAERRGLPNKDRK
jgi:hypothetical protein